VTSLRRRVQTRLLLSTVIFAAAWLGAQTVSTQGQGRNRLREVIDGHEVASGEVLLKFRRPFPAADRQQLRQQLDADESKEIGRNIGVVRLHSRSFSAESLLAFLRTHPAVEYVEPNYIVRAVATPNDSQFGNLWGLLNTGQTVNGVLGGSPGADIHAAAAWDVSTGSTANVVGVIDTGVDYSHPDLNANVWTAPAEFTVTIGGVPITCPAGSHGFNAIAKTCDPLDDNDHGSHVSGTIGAVGNNGTGVAGVNWTASIMGSKFLDATGSGTLANAIDAIEFTIQAKAAGAANVRILNNSWGGGGYSQALLDEINKANANDILFVAAAGNSALNNDSWGFYPADYTYWGATNIIAVAATDNNDHLASFSNYGPALVHLGAPGVNILSTTRGNTYQYFSGTSMATPHVSGAAALVLSKCALTTAALKTTLLNNVDVVSSLSGRVSSNGRLNVDKALRSCAPVAPKAPTNLKATAGNAQVALTWTASSGATSYNVKRSTTSGSGYVTVTTRTTTSYTDTGLANGTPYYYVITALNANGESGSSNEASATPALPAPPPVPTGLTATAGNAKVNLSWNTSAGATSYHVSRSTTTGGGYIVVATVTTTSYTDNGVVNGTKYYYVVSALKASVESGASSEASATPFGPPSRPTGLTASSGPNSGQISLHWTAVTGATSYNVKRSRMNGGSYSTVATGLTSPSYVNSGLTTGRQYYFVVSAVNASGQSSNSNQASAVAK
jgi:subtilisin family serine protease